MRDRENRSRGKEKKRGENEFEHTSFLIRFWFRDLSIIDYGR